MRLLDRSGSQVKNSVQDLRVLSGIDRVTVGRFDKSFCFHSIDGRLWTFSEVGVGAG
jgi:hypothetical protein